MTVCNVGKLTRTVGTDADLFFIDISKNCFKVHQEGIKFLYTHLNEEALKRTQTISPGSRAIDWTDPLVTIAVRLTEERLTVTMTPLEILS